MSGNVHIKYIIINEYITTIKKKLLKTWIRKGLFYSTENFLTITIKDKYSFRNISTLGLLRYDSQFCAKVTSILTCIVGLQVAMQ